MARFIDRLVATFIVFIICTAAAFFITRVIAVSIAIAFCIALCFNLALQNIRRKKNDKNCSSEDLFYHLLKGGGDEVLAATKNLIASHLIVENKQNFFVVLIENKRVGVFSCYKSSAVGIDDVFRVYASAYKENLQAVYIVCRAVDRKAVACINRLDMEFEFLSHKQLYAKLKKQNLLPAIKKGNKRPSIAIIISAVFARKNALPFMLSGGSLALCSLFLPKASAIYYIVLGSINLVLAIVCLFDLSHSKCPKLFQDKSPKNQG